MENMRSLAIDYSHNHKEKFLNRLIQFVEIPSVSTNTEYQDDMFKAAQWLASQLTSFGCDAKIFPTGKHPIVFGSWITNPKNPTVLIYGHYDVQPPDPIELWTTSPFTASLIGDNLYGRGTSDMKGQVMAGILAAEAVTKQKNVPVNLKFIIEGEEEIGSPSIGQFLQENSKLLSCDSILNLDSGMIDDKTPTITYGLRGMAFFEIRIFGPKSDLHSGMFGGVIHNPAQVLCELVTKMHDDTRRVTLPGFYDDVRPLTDKERQHLSRLNLDRDYFISQSGVPDLWGEYGYTPLERIGARPTLEINGMYSGFTGEGSKTIIPSHATAKISTRLVPDQTPSRVFQQLQDFLKQSAPHTVRWEARMLNGGDPCITDIESPAVRAMHDALEIIWGKPPVYTREGGSIPIVAEMQKYLKVDSVLSGFGLHDDNIHAPNEKLHLPTWYKGIDAVIHFIFNIGQQFSG